MGYDEIETRVGTFRNLFTANDGDSIRRYLRGDELGHLGRRRLGNSLSASLESSEEVQRVYDCIGSFGYELGKGLSEDATVETLEDISRDIYRQLMISEHPARRIVYDFFRNRLQNDLPVHGLDREDAEDLLTDALWSGYLSAQE